MVSEDNEKLCAFARHWLLEGDWMTCRSCNHHLIASREGEAFYHSPECKGPRDLHPWGMLRAILNGKDQALPIGQGMANTSVQDSPQTTRDSHG